MSVASVRIHIFDKVTKERVNPNKIDKCIRSMLHIREDYPRDTYFNYWMQDIVMPMSFGDNWKNIRERYYNERIESYKNMMIKIVDFLERNYDIPMVPQS